MVALLQEVRRTVAPGICLTAPGATHSHAGCGYGWALCPLAPSAGVFCALALAQPGFRPLGRKWLASLAGGRYFPSRSWPGLSRFFFCPSCLGRRERFKCAFQPATENSPLPPPRDKRRVMACLIRARAGSARLVTCFFTGLATRGFNRCGSCSNCWAGVLTNFPLGPPGRIASEES
jgi:hypothetical protein